MKAPKGSRQASTLLLILVLAAGAGALPAAAAASPEAAVEELLERIDAGRTDGLEEIVCAAERATVSGLFDPVTALGVSPDDPAARELLDSIDYEVVDRSVSLVDRSDEVARVRLAATIRADLQPDTAEGLARLIVAASGVEMSDQDLADFVPLIVASLAEGQTLDEEVEVVREGDSWRICGTPDEPPVIDATLTDAGICGLVSLAELNALAATAYGANEGDDSFCSWSSIAAEDYYFVNVSLFEGETLDGYESLFPDGEPRRVAGQDAWSTGEQLHVQTPGGVLLVVPFLEEGLTTADLEPLDYAIRVAELILPRLPLLSSEPAASALPSPTTSAASGPSICALLPLEKLEALGPLPYEQASAPAPGMCLYESEDHGLLVIAEEVDLDLVRSTFPGGRELEVAGRPAYADADTLWVALDDRVLTLETIFADSPAAGDLDAIEYAQRVAELLVRAIAAAA